MSKNTAILAKLKESLDIAPWSWLEPHLKRVALIIVDPTMDFMEACLQIALDQKNQITAWIESGKLHKPSQVQIDFWKSSKDTKFKVLVLQPFVIAQVEASS